MRDDYVIDQPTQELSVHVEKDVIAKLSSMHDHTKISVDELVNTALKRFISQHKDFLPSKSSR